MSIESKLEKWAELQRQADKLAGEIKEEVLKLKKTVKTDVAKATYSKGRRTFNWEHIALELDPPKHLISAYSKTVVDWKKVAEELGVPSDLKEKHCTVGNPTVSLKLK